MTDGSYFHRERLAWTLVVVCAAASLVLWRRQSVSDERLVPTAVVEFIGRDEAQPLSVRLVRAADFLAPPPHPAFIREVASRDRRVGVPAGILVVRYRDAALPVLARGGDRITIDLRPAPAGYVRVQAGPGLGALDLTIVEPLDCEGRVRGASLLIGDAEVSVAEFAAFRQAISNATRDADGFTPLCSDLERATLRGGCDGHLSTPASAALWDELVRAGDDRPMRQVSLLDAMAYCRFLDRRDGGAHRLPTASEWERAARGVDGRAFPWGTAPLDATTRGSLLDRLSVRSHPELNSPYGAHHMGSGVAEWTSTRSGARRHVVMGASFDAAADRVHLAFGVPESPHARHAHLGFRVVLESDS